MLEAFFCVVQTQPHFTFFTLPSGESILTMSTPSSRRTSWEMVGKTVKASTTWWMRLGSKATRFRFFKIFVIYLGRRRGRPRHTLDVRVPEAPRTSEDSAQCDQQKWEESCAQCLLDRNACDGVTNRWYNILRKDNDIVGNRFFSATINRIESFHHMEIQAPIYHEYSATIFARLAVGMNFQPNPNKNFQPNISQSQ